jgi:hypothetical protein
MRTAILTDADKYLINTICECVYNCLNGKIDLVDFFVSYIFFIYVYN